MRSKQAFISDSSGTTIYDPINEVTVHATSSPNVVLDRVTSYRGDKDILSGSSCTLAKDYKGTEFLTYIVGGSDNIYLCDFAGQNVYSEMYPQASNIYMHVAFIASAKDTGELDKFYGIAIFYGNVPSTIVLLKDIDEDGYIEEMGHYYWVSGQEPQLYRRFKDTDKDGKADSVSSNKCFIEGIVVSANKAKYNSGDPNFCYTTNSPAVSVGTTIASFAVDAFVKRVPSPYTFLAAIAADCAIAYIDYAGYTKESWPG
jgi:hypothetical protein